MVRWLDIGLLMNDGDFSNWMVVGEGVVGVEDRCRI